ncbi:hypothetical protein ACRRTK_020279 [Alexandromys fortis]
MNMCPVAERTLEHPTIHAPGTALFLEPPKLHPALFQLWPGHSSSFTCHILAVSWRCCLVLILSG